MSINETLYDFINGLNESVEIGEDEYTEDFDSEGFIAVDSETGETVKTKITVLEDEFTDWNDVDKYSYDFGLANIDLEKIDGYKFDDDEVLSVIRNYIIQIRYFVDNQKKEIEGRLNDLNGFLGRINKI